MVLLQKVIGPSNQVVLSDPTIDLVIGFKDTIFNESILAGQHFNDLFPTYDPG